MYINSPGGVVSSGLAIYDTMQFIKPAVSTTVIGQAASMGSLLLTAGEKGMRFALPNCPRHGASAIRRVPGPGIRYRAPCSGHHQDQETS